MTIQVTSERYLIARGDGYVVGDKCITRGNDEEFPTFKLVHDGSIYGTARENVKQKLEPGDELYEPRGAS